MKCPKCKREVEMLKFTTTGVMCRDCHEAERKGTPAVAVKRLVRPFWVSWEQTPEMTPYTIHSPWWTSGHIPHPDGTRFTICCAIMAEDEDDAKKRILRSFDAKPENIEWRFVTEKPAGWSPFCERFPRAGWMIWPNAADQAQPPQTKTL